MQIILLEKIHRLGDIGSIVNVKDGFARNFLLPRKKAIRATKTNIEIFEKRKAEIQKQNEANKAAAQVIADKLVDVSITVVRQAGEDGRLYGSVTARDVSLALASKTGVEINPDTVVLTTKFKEIGSYAVEVRLHPEVSAEIQMNIARTDEEAKAAVAN